MSVKHRIRALKHLKKQQKNPDFANKLGVEVKIKTKDEKNEQVCNC